MSNRKLSGILVSNMKKKNLIYLFLILLICGCSKGSHSIVTGIDEREANVILVFLESKGIIAYKEQSSTGPALGSESTSPKFNIFVEKSRLIDAMAILNSNGLPRRQGTTLLELFPKQGMMTTDREETIRFQAGLASQIMNMILMIDGVIDASVQISFPQTNVATIGTEVPEQRVTASVFVKHQGIIDDPNSHLETKIKRLVSGSIQGLNINDVTVVSDRSRFTDITLNGMGECLTGRMDEYVKIWSIVMSKESAAKFRSIFFLLLTLAILLLASIGWLTWKFYPVLRTNGGFSKIFSPIPFFKRKKEEKNPVEPKGT